VFGPQHGGARLVAGDFRGEAAHGLRTEAVPLRQQAGGVRFDHQRLVQVERCRGLVHVGWSARRDAGELRCRPDRGKGRPPGACGTADDKLGSVYGEEPAVRPERRGPEATRCRNETDLAGRGVPGGGEYVLRDAMPPGPSHCQVGKGAVSAADHSCHACSVSPGAQALQGTCPSARAAAVTGQRSGGRSRYS